MRILVTGGAGFIGSNFIRYWLAHHPEDSIINLDALTYAGNLQNLTNLPAHRHTFIHGDIRDPKAVHQAMEGVEIVVHFAAESHVDRSIEDSQAFLTTNVLGTQILLEEVRKRGTQIKRFHHVSTDEVFGSLELDEAPFDEKTPYAPRSPYSASKAASDHLCRSYVHTHGLPITISNCSNNYGPHHFPEKFIPLLIVNALHDESLPIYGDGLQMRDWIHVEDHCRGIEAILLHGRIGETYCLGGNAECRNIDVAKTILQILKKPESLIKYIEDRKGHDHRYAILATKAFEELGWQPIHTFEEGLQDTIDWFLEHRDWWKPLLPKTKRHTTHETQNISSSMKILIFGAGFMGKRLAESWPDAVLDSARIDDKEAVLRAIDQHQPDAIVNAAGKTGIPNVDWCETHQAETARGNIIGPLILAEACAERSIYLLHIGSGCIFYGPSPDPAGWFEHDFANPESYYSQTKYAADLGLSKLPNLGIARIRMPIDSSPSHRNLIDKLASYPRVIDVENSVTVIEDAIRVFRELIEKRAVGIFHVTNPGAMRHRDLLSLYQELVEPNHRCSWIQPEELVTSGLAKTSRSNCILQSPRLAEYGMTMRPVQEALRETMMKYAAAKHPLTSAPHLTMQIKPLSYIAPIPTGSKRMKGVILAGGRGTRLAPLTNVTNKHLLPVANRQMILYPLQTLLDAGIRDILLITGPEYSGHFMTLLGSGSTFGCRLTYRIQDEAGGIAHALSLAESFVGQDNCTVILGDNIFDENFLSPVSSFQSGAMTFYKAVDDPERFGVVEIDGWGQVRSIEEKPTKPKTNLAQVGLYIYDTQVFDIIRSLKPSGRGELEIADVNNHYLSLGKLTAKPVRGFWSDAGTFPSLQRGTEYFVRKEGRARQN